MDTAKKTPIYNLVILDKSGSMEAIRTEAINGYNDGSAKFGYDKTSTGITTGTGMSDVNGIGPLFT